MTIVEDAVVWAAIRHYEHPDRAGVCAGCGNAFPCDVIRLADELRRERVEHAYARAVLMEASEVFQRSAPWPWVRRS